MDASVWVLFVVTETLLCLTPGPAVLYVVSYGLRYGPGSAIPASLGIVTGNVIYFALSAAGLGTLILSSHTLFLVVKWVGAVYLIRLGLMMIVARTEQHAGDPTLVAAARRRHGRAFRGGVLVQLANPKNLIFFLAILPQFIDPSGAVALQIVILGLTSQVIELLVLSAYASAAGRFQGIARRAGLTAWFKRAAGALLIGIGIRLAVIRQDQWPPANAPDRAGGLQSDTVVTVLQS